MGVYRRVHPSVHDWRSVLRKEVDFRTDELVCGAFRWRESLYVAVALIRTANCLIVWPSHRACTASSIVPKAGSVLQWIGNTLNIPVVIIGEGGRAGVGPRPLRCSLQPALIIIVEDRGKQVSDLHLYYPA